MYLALQPGGWAGSTRAGHPGGADRPRRTTSSRPSQGLAEPVRADRHRPARPVAQHARRPDPEHPGGVPEALDGVSDLSANVAAQDEQINTLLGNLDKVSGCSTSATGHHRADARRRRAVPGAGGAARGGPACSTRPATCPVELTLLVRETRADLKPALDHLDSVVDVLNKNEDNLDNSLRLMAPFYRVFANTLGNGPWFDTYIQNLPPSTEAGGLDVMGKPAMASCAASCVALGRSWPRRVRRCSPARRRRRSPRTSRGRSRIYEGTDVRVLGVPVGKVETVEPAGTDVKVTMSYDAEVQGARRRRRPSSSRRRSWVTGSSSSPRSTPAGQVLRTVRRSSTDRTAVPSSSTRSTRASTT